MTFDFGAFNEYGKLAKVAMRKPAEAFVSDAKIDAEWRDLNYHARPDLVNAAHESDQFEGLMTAQGTEILHLPAAANLTLDALYTRDALVVTPRGIVLPRMGKPQRRNESAVNSAALAKLGIPIAGELTGEAKLEGGDLVWLDQHTLLAGVGYRSNLEGVRQLQAICGNDVHIHWFDLPHFKGPSDVFHLMSVLSPIDHDLAVVYLPLMPVRLVELLQSRDLKFVDVPQQEFDSMGCNVLAIAPRHVVSVDGNPETVRRMQAAGATVEVIAASNISRKGEGGPTCLTRPLVRDR
jgi:N-dimethylarginine dimethylaminohydrolase